MEALRSLTRDSLGGSTWLRLLTQEKTKEANHRRLRRESSAGADCGPTIKLN